jgi:hypothetical protein
MITSIFVSITLFSIAYFVTMKKKLHKQINTFLFFLINIININFFIVIGENFKKMELTKEIDKYLPFLLYRNILIPLSILVGIHFFICSALAHKRVLVTFITVGSLYVLEVICQRLHFFQWKQWSEFYSIVYYFLLFIIAAISVLLIRKMVDLPMREKQ